MNGARVRALSFFISSLAASLYLCIYVPCSPPFSLQSVALRHRALPISSHIVRNVHRIRGHRDALKTRLAIGSLGLEELEFAVRMMIMSGRFAGTQGIPETMLMPHLPEKFLAPPSPFRTIAELASSLPWLLRVHQSMQWVQQMPNGLMTVQRLICPAASELGGLAAPVTPPPLMPRPPPTPRAQAHLPGSCWHWPRNRLFALSCLAHKLECR